MANKTNGGASDGAVDACKVGAFPLATGSAKSSDAVTLEKYRDLIAEVCAELNVSRPMDIMPALKRLRGANVKLRTALNVIAYHECDYDPEEIADQALSGTDWSDYLPTTKVWREPERIPMSDQQENTRPQDGPPSNEPIGSLPLAPGSPYGLADYRDAMVEARRERDGLSSQLLAQSIDASEWLDEVAAALGIQTGRESWWEGSEEDRRKKILTRIKKLRANAEISNAPSSAEPKH